MVNTSVTRSIGAVSPSLPGVKVTELLTRNNADTPGYGAVAILGVFKRGPMGIPIPVRNSGHYTDIFGRPGDPDWHLYKDGMSLAPDAIDGFFAEAGNNDVWLIRNELDGSGTKAETTLYSRTNKLPVLQIFAANEGRWGGAETKIEKSPLVVVTEKTFTLVAGETKANEYRDAIASFTEGSGSDYVIVANTAADEISGEVIFTISSQYNLLSDGVSGPAILSGTSSYERDLDLSGTVEIPSFSPLIGTVSSNDSVLTGTGTAFSEQLQTDDVIYFNGEPRLVISITSDTTLTIESPFSSTLDGDTITQPNLTVTGTGTQFTNELSVGDSLIIEIDDNIYSRTIDAIASDTELTINTAFSEEIPTGTVAKTENYWVEDSATGTNFDTELNVGDYIIDPNRTGEAVKVVEIDTTATPSRFRVEKKFAEDFDSAQIAKQANSATVALLPNKNEGLEIEIGQGVRYPATHFSLKAYFQGSQVFAAEDLSLDPNDPQSLYAEEEINNRNVAYRSGNKIYNQWISAKVLFQGAYTTSKDNDVRPAVSNEKILAVEGDRLYSIESFERTIVTGRLFYPQPYDLPRAAVRIKGHVAPQTFEGNITVTGTGVIGTGTVFATDFRVGDYLYNPTERSARKIINVESDTQIELESAFDNDILAADSINPIRSGYFLFDRGSNIEQLAREGEPYFCDIRSSLKKGYDGDLSNITPSQWTRYFDFDRDLLGKAIEGKQQGLIRIAVPGISEPSVSRAAFSYAERKAFIFRAEIPESMGTAAEVENFINNDLGRSYYEVAYPSYGNINSPFSRGTRLIPLTGDILGVESRLAAIAQGYHEVGAGSKAALSRVVSLITELNSSDIELLNSTGVQPIKLQNGNYIPYGNTSPSTSAIYRLIHVKRMQSHYMRVLEELTILADQMFKRIGPAELQEILMVVEDFFRGEYRKGALTNLLSIDDTYRVNVPLIEAVGTTKKDVVTSIVNGKIEIFVSYLPVGITEKIEVFIAPDIATVAYSQAN